LPLGLYERASHLAVTRGQSLNRLFQDGLQLLDSQDRDQRLFDDFTAIAEAQGDESDCLKLAPFWTGPKHFPIFPPYGQATGSFNSHTPNSDSSSTRHRQSPWCSAFFFEHGVLITWRLGFE